MPSPEGCGHVWSLEQRWPDRQRDRGAPTSPSGKLQMLKRAWGSPRAPPFMNWQAEAREPTKRRPGPGQLPACRVGVSRPGSRSPSSGKPREGLSTVHGRPLEATGSMRPRAGPPSRTLTRRRETLEGLGRCSLRGTGPEGPLQQPAAHPNSARLPRVSRQRTASSSGRTACLPCNSAPGNGGHRGLHQAGGGG